MTSLSLNFYLMLFSLISVELIIVAIIAVAPDSLLCYVPDIACL